MRGARFLRDCKCNQLRIIPADAGSTAATRLAERTSKDHPRGCGEHSLVIWCLREAGGSSPRMRGAQNEKATVQEGLGIIPADAGSTHRQSS